MHESQSWAHANFFNFARKTITWQHDNVIRASRTRKTTTLFRHRCLNGLASPNIQYTVHKAKLFYGLKTWSRCRGSVVACPALMKVFQNSIKFLALISFFGGVELGRLLRYHGPRTNVPGGQRAVCQVAGAEHCRLYGYHAGGHPSGARQATRICSRLVVYGVKYKSQKIIQVVKR